MQKETDIVNAWLLCQSYFIESAVPKKQPGSAAGSKQCYNHKQSSKTH